MLPSWFWIGFNDRETEDEWVWVSGEPVTYTFWGDGEPNDTAGGQDCAVVGRSTPWDDGGCHGTFAYICEYELPEVEAIGLTCTIDEESTDADGDPITYTFDWDVDGTEFTDTDSTTHTGDSVPADALGHEELWTCEVTPDDGDDEGSFGVANFFVEQNCSEDGEYAAFEFDDACPVAHWNMETLSSSGKVADLIEDVDLVIHGSPTPSVEGISGATYEMNSCGDFFMSDTAYPPSLVGSGPKSISAWANLGSKGGDGDGQQPLVSFGGGIDSCGGTAFAVNYTTEHTGEDSPMLGTCGHDYDLRTSAPAWYVDSWYHIVGTYDGTTLRLYVDGEEVGSRGVGISTSTTFDKVGIGVETWWSGTYHWLCDGRVDEVKLYDYALSGDDIDDLYELHAGGVDSCARGQSFDCPAHSCQAVLDDDPAASDGLYWLSSSDGSTYEGHCDMTTDGGGWLLLLSYNHDAGTNPLLDGGRLPLSTDAGFSHTGTDAIGYPSVEEARFYCDTDQHERIIHFKTSNPHILAAAQNPAAPITWSPSDWSSGFTPLTGHSGVLPAASSGVFDTGSLTEFPFYVSSAYHWAIRSWDYRWECDAPEAARGYDFDTKHHIWVR